MQSQAKFALDRVQLVPARHLQAGDEAVGSRIVAVRSSREKQRIRAKSAGKRVVNERITTAGKDYSSDYYKKRQKRKVEGRQEKKKGQILIREENTSM